MAIADLHAKSVEWTGEHTVRITYDWTDADQLLDWAGTTGITPTIVGGVVTFVGSGGTDVWGMKWAQTLTVSQVTMRARIMSTTDYLNLYTNLNAGWVGSPWNANPSIGVIWANYVGGAVAVNNGVSTPITSYALTRTTWYDFQTTFTTSYVSFTVDGGAPYQHNDTYAPSTSGLLAVGAYSNYSEFGTIVIEGTTTETRPQANGGMCLVLVAMSD